MQKTAVKNCCTPSRSGAPENLPESKPVIAAGNEKNHGDSTIPIPGGEGFIGTNKALIEADEEAPLRPTKIKPFRMDKTTVTNGRFAQFVAATGYKTEAEILGDSFVFVGFLGDNADHKNTVADAPWWQVVKGACWRHPAGPDSHAAALPDHPVVHVSWNDAAAFAAWAGGRLPTEEEWEHAARGGLEDAVYCWGDRAPDDENFFPCNIWQGQFPEHNSEKDGFAGTAPALSFAPNRYGLYNMLGNVWEWTAQIFIIRSFKKSVHKMHQDKEGFKICKGGSYLCHSSYCHRYRIAARTANSPESSTGHTGFRLVYDD